MRGALLKVIDKMANIQKCWEIFRNFNIGRGTCWVLCSSMEIMLAKDALDISLCFWFGCTFWRLIISHWLGVKIDVA